jgi:lysophospholipase L1-like esterase
VPGGIAVLRFLGSCAVLGAASFVLAGCGSSATTGYYVSLGDSYSVGYQPLPQPASTSGYTAVVAKATGLRLVNFGCAGATTSTILRSTGCLAGAAAATHAAHYPSETQAQAAVSFIEHHKGDIGLVTVTIGGNDILSCEGSKNLFACAQAELAIVRADLKTLVTELRRAAGTTVPIIGLTYPDVFLGNWVFPPGKAAPAIATLSVGAFEYLLNPALRQAYQSAGAHFVDITDATGAYIPLSTTETMAPYGNIPVAVARVCSYTWYCSVGNIHANSSGYTFIGDQVVKEYDQLTR